MAPPPPSQQPPLLPLQLLVFDSRRGNDEGSEDDKVLAAWPARGPIEDASGLAGLLQGLLLFSSTFGEGAWEVAETDKAVWVLREAEPHIWFAAAAAKAWLPRHATEDGLRAVLAHTHALVVLLGGPLQALLDADASAVTAQEVLLPVLAHVGRALSSAASWHHRELRNPLSPGAAPPLLRLPPGAALALQACANRMLLDAPAGGGPAAPRPVAELAMLWGPRLLWSSLLPADTAALYALLATALLHPGGGRGGGAAAAAAAEAATGPAGVLESAAWQLLPSGFIVRRGGGLEAAVRSDAEPAVDAPLVCLPASRRRLRLLPLAHGKLLAVLLLEPQPPLSSDLLTHLHRALAGPAAEVAAAVAESVRAGRAEAGHVPGYRFVAVAQQQQQQQQQQEEGAGGEAPAAADGGGGFLGGGCWAQASPRDKVSGMSHHARALAASLRDSLARAVPAAPGCTGGWRGAAEVREEVLHPERGGTGAAQQAAAGGGSGGGGNGNGGNSHAARAASWHVDATPREVLVRSSGEVWAAAATDDERRLLVVRERRTERSLAEAAAAMEALESVLL